MLHDLIELDEHNTFKYDVSCPACGTHQRHARHPGNCLRFSCVIS